MPRSTWAARSRGTVTGPSGAVAGADGRRSTRPSRFSSVGLGLASTPRPTTAGGSLLVHRAPSPAPTGCAWTRPTGLAPGVLERQARGVRRRHHHGRQEQHRHRRLRAGRRTQDHRHRDLARGGALTNPSVFGLPQAERSRRRLLVCSSAPRPPPLAAPGPRTSHPGTYRVLRLGERAPVPATSATPGHADPAHPDRRRRRCRPDRQGHRPRPSRPDQRGR